MLTATETKPLTVMLVDGDTLVRSALAQLLENKGGVEVTAAPEGTSRAVSAALGHKPDVILCNPEDKGMEELSVSIEGFHNASPESAVLILTNRDEPKFARDALNAGANGYLLLSDEPEDLFQAVQRAAKGNPTVTPRVAVGIAQLDRGDSEVLTPREVETVSQIALGYTNREIAENLFLSQRTVESHRANILGKLGFHSRAELVRYAMDNNLLDRRKSPTDES
jgi:two-component system response regulator NreC